MANLALVYGMRLFPADELSEITEATLQLKDGRTARVTMHLIEGSKGEIEKTLRQSVDAFFDLRGILAIAFVLMAINRLSGLILPGSTKYLYDDVFINRRVHLLLPIVMFAVGATLIQGFTSFALTQLLSKSSQRMISELRSKVQAHIGRLPVSFYDANKTGALDSLIMSDVEGVRNLIGTGLVEFVGGLMTAVIALVYLIHTSVTMTGV